MTADRERDRLGRARNARPRDGLGRPLPRGSELGTERVPNELHLSVADAVDLAQDYLDRSRPFHAHEVLEALWKTEPSTERDLWQGLAQIAVGLTHALRGNATGATALLRRGAGRMKAYVGPEHDIAVAEVIAWAEALATDPTVAPPPLRLRA